MIKNVVENTHERKVKMKKEEIIEKTKNSLPSVRGADFCRSAGVNGEAIARTFIGKNQAGIMGEVIAFEREKLTDITSPLTPQRLALLACTQSRMAHSSPTRNSVLNEERGKRAAFTLAETLITLTILGVVAAITVPSLINKQIESANRTKLKKAMAVYEKALNQMIIDNDIKGSVATEFPSGNCTVTTKYFKKIKETNDCVFQTADRVWWDITDITHPLISLKDEIKADNKATLTGNADSLDDDKTSFVMVGEIKNGIVRINDNGESTLSSDEKKYLGKLYGFINGSKNKEEYCGGLCKASQITEACTTSPYRNCYRISGKYVSYYDENGKIVMSKSGCTNNTGENCTDGSVYDFDIPLENGGTREIQYYDCDGNGDCTGSQVSDLNIPLENGGTRKIDYYGCDGNGENCTVSYVYDLDIPLENGGTRKIDYYDCGGNGDCTGSYVSDLNIPLENGGTGYIDYYDCNGTGEDCESSSVYGYDIPLKNGGTGNIDYSGCNGNGEDCSERYCFDSDWNNISCDLIQ